MDVLYYLKLEYHKFRKNSVINLLFVFFCLTMPFVILLGKEFDQLPDQIPSTDYIFKFPMIWEYNGYIGSWLTFFFLGLISVFIVGSEINYKTYRQNIIAGLTRRQFFTSKLVAIVMLSLAATLIYCLSCIIVGLFHSNNVDFARLTDTSWAPLRFYLMTFGYCSFGLLCGFWLRRSGVAVMFYLIYILILEPILKWGVHFKALQNASINYWPMNAIEDLMPFPLFRFADAIPRDDLNFSFLLTNTQAIVTSSIYILIFLTLVYRNVSKRDM